MLSRHFLSPSRRFRIHDSATFPLILPVQYTSYSECRPEVLWLNLEGEGSVHEKSHLHEVFPAIPFHWVCEKLALRHNVIKSSEASIITAENNPILATLIDTDTIISEALGGVEVEDEKQSRTLVNDDFVGFVL